MSDLKKEDLVDKLERLEEVISFVELTQKSLLEIETTIRNLNYELDDITSGIEHVIQDLVELTIDN